MLGKFLDPKNDVAFRKIFGTEKNKDILIHFLNDVIKFGKGTRIKDVTFLPTIQDPEIKAQKTSIVDILCTDQKKNNYIVEMQIAKEKGFAKRAQYYASKAYSSQLNVGGEYHTLKAVIFLAIADFTMFPNKKGYQSDHIILDTRTHENDLKDFSFTFLELPKFTKTIDELSNTTEMWCYFFKHAEETSPEELHKLVGQDQIIGQAYEVLDRYSWSKAELLEYDQAEKHMGAYLASLAQKVDEGVKIGREQGIKIGIEKGEKMGIEKGEKIGIEKGEKAAFLKAAKNMLKQGLKIQDIQKATGLSKQQILKLQK
jgi:predicted transposase/invertase (TIGR01784 family)